MIEAKNSLSSPLSPKEIRSRVLGLIERTAGIRLGGDYPPFGIAYNVGEDIENQYGVLSEQTGISPEALHMLDLDTSRLSYLADKELSGRNTLEDERIMHAKELKAAGLLE